MTREAAKKVIILGTGGNCIDILESMLDINHGTASSCYDIQGFLDDDQNKTDTKIDGYPVLGSLKDAPKFKECYFVNGIGSPNNFRRKKEIIDSTGLSTESFISIIHPTAYISRSATLGIGVVVFQNVTITSHVSVGDHVVVLPQTVISHDANIGDYVCIAGGVNISGRVQIGGLSYIGSGANIIGGVTIGAGSLVGMGSVVLRDVQGGSVVAGVPAKPLS